MTWKPKSFCDCTPKQEIEGEEMAPFKYKFVCSNCGCEWEELRKGNEQIAGMDAHGFYT